MKENITIVKYNHYKITKLSILLVLFLDIVPIALMKKQESRLKSKKKRPSRKVRQTRNADVSIKEKKNSVLLIRIRPSVKETDLC